MASPITQNLDVLKKAQQLDSEIHHAHVRLEEIPSERAQLKSELELEKIRLNELETVSYTHLTLPTNREV